MEAPFHYVVKAKLIRSSKGRDLNLKNTEKILKIIVRYLQEEKHLITMRALLRYSCKTRIKNIFLINRQEKI